MRRAGPSLLLIALVTGAGLAAWLGASMAPATSSESASQFLAHVAGSTIAAGSARFTVTSVSRSPVALQNDRSIGTGVVQFSTDSARMVRIDHGHEILSGSGTVSQLESTRWDVIHGRTYLALGVTTVGIPGASWIAFPKSFNVANPMQTLASIAGVSWLGPSTRGSVHALGPARLGLIETQRYSVTEVPGCGGPASALPRIWIWVDPLGRLVQLRQVESISGPLRTKTVTTLRLRDFGAPVTISAPEPTRGIRQSLGGASISRFSGGTCRAKSSGIAVASG